MLISSKKIALLLIIATFSFIGISQAKTTSKNNNKVSVMYFMEAIPAFEAGLSVGAANAMTDISSNGSSSKISFSEISPNGFSPAASVFVRHRFNEIAAVKSSLGNMHLRDDDSWSSLESISNRGKYFTNDIFELAVVGELYVPRHLINNKNEFRVNTLDLYVFGGLSGFYHSPSIGGPILDNYDLLVQTDPDAFNNWQAAIPFGGGIKLTIARSWTIGMDFNLRYTFMDELDGFSRPVSNANDLFFTTKFNLGFIIDTREKGTNYIPNKYIFGPRRPNELTKYNLRGVIQ